MENSDIDFNLLNSAAKALILALKERDLYTQMHSRRVISLSLELGLACGLTSEEINALKLSACFHDIGKIGIRDSILLKPGRLSPQEMELMTEHPVKGESLDQDPAANTG
jgi:HD-GYP domain-containing protein (c-di-GMP phosphodiesterase class II)